MVVTLKVGNSNVYLILVDRGNSIDVLSRFAFDKMGLTSDILKPSRSPLSGFFGDKVVPNGNIDLPLSTGGPDYQKALIVKFLVVNIPLVYSIILG